MDHNNVRFHTIYTVQSPYNAKFGCVTSESCYKGTILYRNHRKMTMKWSFSYDSFVKFQGKKIGAIT